MAFKKSLAAVVLLFVGLCALALFLPGQVEGRTWYVDDDGGADFERIQDAVNASEDGDTIRVEEGIYEENVVLNRTVSLVGNGSEETVLVGNGNDSVLDVTVDWVNVSGLGVRNSGRDRGAGDAGIKVGSENVTIAWTNCSENRYGMYLHRARNCTLANTTLYKNSEGIKLVYSDQNHIINTRCFEDGIYLEYANDTVIENTTTWWEPGSMDFTGINLLESSGCWLGNNTLDHSGISLSGGKIEHWTTHEIDQTNTINGKPVLYIQNQTGGIVPSGAAQIILAGCSEMMARDQEFDNVSVAVILGFSSHITIENNTFTSCGSGALLRSSDNCTIRDNQFFHSYSSDIYLSSSDYNRVLDNLCLGDGALGGSGPWAAFSQGNRFRGNRIENRRQGLSLSWSSNTTLSNNEILNCGLLGVSLWEASDNIIIENICRNNSDGIQLGQDCDRNIIQGNNCSENRNVGIALSLFWHSNTIYSSCDDNTLRNNKCLDNVRGIVLSGWRNTIDTNNCSGGEQGIYMGTGHENTIMRNNITGNNESGIYIYDSDDNQITDNNITRNRMGILLLAKYGYDRYDRTDDYSRGNRVHGNRIHDNLEFGINVTNNGGNVLDASNNFWDSDTGPYHPVNNSAGSGDNVTDFVDFSRWADEEGNTLPRERDETKTISLGLSILLSLITIILCLLMVVVKLPDNVFKRPTKHSGNENEPSPEPPQRINTCPHCGGEFEITTQKRPLRFNCHFCGKEIEFG